MPRLPHSHFALQIRSIISGLLDMYAIASSLAAGIAEMCLDASGWPLEGR